MIDSLQLLTRYLYQIHGVKTIVLMDENDTPIQGVYAHGYYDEMITFMKEFAFAALKDSSYLENAVLTGILGFSEIFLNNLSTYSLFDTQYAEHFGFTEAEAVALLESSASMKI